jgi:hypothetical protein
VIGGHREGCRSRAASFTEEAEYAVAGRRWQGSTRQCLGSPGQRQGVPENAGRHHMIAKAVGASFESSEQI